MKNNRPEWSSKYAFVLSSIGSAVGLGNIWRFPYIMGEYGGAVFLFVYILIIIAICFIPLVSEIYFGRMTQKDCIGAYESVNKNLKYISYLNPLAGILIASFYFVVGGWIIHYIFYYNSQIQDFEGYFSNLIQAPFCPCVLTLSFLFICIFYVARGVKKGIETANKVLMPIFALILLFLVGFSLTLPNANLGLEYMFKPDFSKINSQMILAALGQAFFTLSIGMGVLSTYGSYISEKQNITKSAYLIVLADTLFAILAGIMIFPAVFAFGLSPGSGAGLVFVTLPTIFAQIPLGHLVSGLFFALLFCAAVTSGISLLEVPCAVFTERFKLSRLKASILLFCLISLLAVPASLSFGILGDFKIFNKNIFDFLDFVASNILLPFNSLILCLILGWRLKVDGNLFFKNTFLAKLFEIGLKYVVPIALIFLLYVGLR